jgi:biotin carboxyl carrier protein
MLQVKSKFGEHEVERSEEQGVLGVVDGEILNGDIVKMGPTSYHMIANGRSFNIEVLNLDREAKACTLSINKQPVTLDVKDDFDRMLDKLGLSQAFANKVNDLKAPMPGLVLDIKVKPGQEVTKGTPLLVLEAMKMENILKAPVDGTIKSIPVEKGVAVEKNTPLIIFE